MYEYINYISTYNYVFPLEAFRFHLHVFVAKLCYFREKDILIKFQKPPSLILFILLSVVCSLFLKIFNEFFISDSFQF